MPKIIIQAQTADGRAVTLAEDAVSYDLQDEHDIAQLIERVGWALTVAERLELRASSSQVDGATRRRSFDDRLTFCEAPARQAPARTHTPARRVEKLA